MYCSEDNTETENMARLMTQVSIESPTHMLKECIFNFDEPMPEVPDLGARVKVSSNKEHIILLYIGWFDLYVNDNFHINP